MVATLQRGMFWRVYLTLLGGLFAVALLAGGLWHWLGEGPMPMPRSPVSAALAALMPPADAPIGQTRQALERISAALKAPVVLLGANGVILAAAPPLSGLRPALKTGWPSHFPDGRTLLIAAPARMNGGPHILGMLMAIAAAVGVAAFPVVSRLTRRLERLRGSLDAWGAGQMAVRASVEGDDEIAAVAASFNAAADRVEALLAAHKALLAHASHELRSPLARLRLAVEMYASSPDPSLLPSIEADIAELDGLVEEILLASRLDHATDLPERETVDLLGLAAEEAARSGVVVRHSGSESFEVEGSARWLRRMIRNLIENASKHGRPPIEVDLRRSGERSERVVIAVSDSGPGIPEAEREHVFEPFYRPTGRAEAAGGWGLGLSIVRQIAQRHGGRASCGPGGFEVEIPAAPIQ